MTFFTDEQIAYLSKSTVRADFLVKFEFVSETVYIWNGHYDLTVDGIVYRPMHGIAKIDGLSIGSGDQTSRTVTLSTSGISDNDLNLTALALQQTPEANQQLVTIYLQLFDEDWQPVGSPIAVFFGFMQPPEIDSDAGSELIGGQQILSITAENAFFNRSRPPSGRYTDRDQQALYPGDKIFQFVPSLIFKTLTYPDY